MSTNNQINANSSRNGDENMAGRGRGTRRGSPREEETGAQQIGAAGWQTGPSIGPSINVSGNNDMEIDDPIGARDQPTRMPRDNSSLENAIWAMVEEGRRRDMVLQALFQRLTGDDELSSPPPRQQQTVPTYHVMPDLSANIVDFTGDTGSIRAKDWLETIESMRRLHTWPDNFALEAARLHLKSGAREWFIINAREIESWDQFRRAFRATFVTTESTTALWKRMTDRIQQKDESLCTYFHAKAKLCNDVKLNLEDTKEQLLVGLWSRELCNAMAARNHATRDDLLHDILQYDRMITQRVDRIRTQKDVNASKPKQNVNTTSTSTTGPTKITKNPTTDRNADKRPPIVNQDGPPKCYNCNNYGHISKDCTEPRREGKCLKCNGKGHTQRHCTVKDNVPAKPVNVIDGNDHRAVSKYLKLIRVNESELKALIDPGSSECTIKASVALIEQFDITRVITELKSFGPEQFKVKSPGVVCASITVDEVTVNNVTLRVVPDDAQTVDVLVGRTFTEAPHVEYHKVGNQLLFKVSNETHQHDELETHEQVQTELPPYSINVVTMKADDEEYSFPVLNLSTTRQTITTKNSHPRGDISRLPAMKTEEGRRPIERADIDVGNQQPDEIIEDLLKVINKYRDCVATNLQELGCTNKVSMDIRETPGARPVSSKPYRASDAEREIIKSIVSEWKSEGIVTETDSPYASPVLLVKKKNGEARLVVDYRRLNKQTERMHFPLPDLDDHLTKIGDSSTYITLDLAHGYLQVPLNEDARAKTAFITPDETGEFTRMMFGLMNSPFYFSKAMYKALGPLRDQVVLFYLDDIFIPGKDWSDLKARLIAVFEALRDARLTIKLTKCKFLKEKVTYLGFEISKNGIEPGEHKIKAIADYPTPSDVHTVRRFLGMTSFFRRFVPKFAEIASPLHELLKKDRTFTWGSRENDAFKELKNALTNKPILQAFNSKNATEIHTDASAQGLAAMLLQRGTDNRWHLVYAISRRTSETERNYHSSKLELLAIVWAVGRLRNLLINIPFRIITDCQALLYLNTEKTKSAQIVRWANELSEFDFEVAHRPGTKLAHVDALSRAPVGLAESENAITERLSEVFTILSETDEIVMYQYVDDDLREKKEILSKPASARTSREKGEVTGYECREGILYKKEGQRLLYVVPRAMRKSLVIRFHDLQGHPGLDRTSTKLLNYYYFPGVRRYVKYHIRACVECIMAKGKPGVQAGLLHPIPPGIRPFAIVHVDHLGPLITTPRQNKYIFAMIDNLTKFVILKAVRSTKVVSVVKALEEFVLNFGAPMRIISDRGTCFTSKRFAEFCQQHGIRHTLNSPRHPQANGQIERMNSTLIPVLRANLEDDEGRDWDTKLKIAQRNLNDSCNATTGKTPFELLYGYTARHDEGRMRALTVESEANYTRPEDLQEEARQRIVAEQGRYKERYDRNRSRNAIFNAGDIVFMKVGRVATGESTKFQNKYRGPLVVTKVLPSDTYAIADLQQDQQGRKYAATAHASQLKIWRPSYDPRDELEGDESLEKDPEKYHANLGEPIVNEDNVPDDTKTESTEDVGTRPKRNRTTPVRYSDYVTDGVHEDVHQ